MDFLRFLQSLRNPVCDTLVAAVTYLGDEIFFMVVGMVMLWCVNKKWGYRFMIAGLAGTTLNQLLKAIFLIPRPWVLDPTFAIVEAARAAATGYSFPSGHTQSAALVFGMLAMWAHKKWVTVLAVVMTLLVGFSRMYLGVHTPMDVGVSLATGLLTVLGACWLFDRAEHSGRGKAAIGLGSWLFSLVLVLYVLFAPKREANVAEFDLHGLKSAWTLLGTLTGMLIAWWVDERHTRFEVKAVWWVQLIKAGGGLLIVLALKEGLKPLLNPIFGEAMVKHAIRYGLMAVGGGVLWPMAFRRLAALGNDAPAHPAADRNRGLTK